MNKPSGSKKRRRVRLKRNDFIFLLICIFVFGGFLYTVFGQEKSLSDIRKNIADNEKRISVLEEEYKDLEETEAKNSGDEFYEEKARDEGYIREDEVLFVVGN